MVTVAALFYGDFPELARRLLDSLSRQLPSPVVDRVVLRGNAVGVDTYGALRRFAQAAPCPVDVHCSAVNQYKYPALREVVARLPDDPERVLMWFDDDSCIRPEAAPGWFALATLAMADADFLGQPWRIALRRGQKAWIQSRPWFANRPISDPMGFPQGAWWMARAATLRRHDWPDPGVNHRGGDVMTGALIEQQCLTFQSWSHGVAINADERLRDSRSPRRGYDESPAGSDD